MIMVDMSLTPEQQRIQQLAREFTAQHILPVDREWDEKGEFHEFILEEVKKAGLNCMAVPQEYGGPGYDAVTQSLVAEEWGYGCAAFATTLGGNGLSSYPLAIAGTDEQKRLYYGRLVNGGMGGFALTEPGAGSDAGACATIAKLDGDEWIINGTKCFATTCGYADIMVIFASTDPSKGVKGLSAFIVEKEREGVVVGAVEHKMGIRSSNTVELLLKNVRVPKSHLLGKEGEGMKLAMKTLDMARPIVASLAVGVGRRALDEAVKYAKEYLDINGKPIGQHQAVAFKLADMATRVEAARQLVRNALRLKDAGVPYTKEAAMAKTFATDAAMRVTADAVELMGQYGYSRDSVVEKLMRDAKVTQIYEGTNQVQRIVISGILLNS
ncbi:Acyl-CoA dehydrogenase [Sporomusa sphaeroides DSM 2875]|uniref:Acyl-CoA dehydrogenase n=2 Tax=Sporomusa TaxID=2375 RepID=A0ABM9W2G3_9FIRM|nr:acyl-CoA dehydrogenase [Sporomusa sphaeroides DSM 2875]CVK19363.1 Acyl-CoA dehydrogenase [Sporomusa sphaeroides DSM 2875]